MLSLSLDESLFSLELDECMDDSSSSVADLACSPAVPTVSGIGLLDQRARVEAFVIIVACIMGTEWSVLSPCWAESLSISEIPKDMLTFLYYMFKGELKRMKAGEERGELVTLLDKPYLAFLFNYLPAPPSAPAVGTMSVTVSPQRRLISRLNIPCAW
jgi:hypothetical protein